jgi:hypothetical protein
VNDHRITYQRPCIVRRESLEGLLVPIDGLVNSGVDG